MAVPQGETLGILGANGAGKTTTLRTISGLKKPTSGTIRIAGTDITSASPQARVKLGLGHVPEGRRVFPAMTVQENLELGAFLRRDRAGIAEDLEGVFARFPVLAERSKQPAGTLSGGEQQRTAIGVSLANKPVLLLADEPTGSLDSVSGQDICRLLRELCDEQRRTIVVVTHEPSVAMWADRAVILRDGRDLAGFPIARPHNPEALATAYQHAVQSAESRS